MTKLFLLHPEVAGGFGPSTVILEHESQKAERAEIPIVAVLEYRFEGWMGDELLETFPCFIVTANLASDMQHQNLSGCRLDNVMVTSSENFKELHPPGNLTDSKRLLPMGFIKLGEKRRIISWSGEDVSMTQRAELVVSQRCLDVMQGHRLSFCEVEELVEL